MRPYTRNARTHSEDQIERIAASIQQFGFLQPILVDGKAGGILTGHGRLRAAQHLKMKTVPVIQAAHLSAAQRRAYVLADNKLAELAGWDEAVLAKELAAIQDSINLEDLGFSDTEIERLLADLESGGAADASPQLAGIEYRVIVDCKSETHQAALLGRFEKEGLPCRALIS